MEEWKKYATEVKGFKSTQPIKSPNKPKTSQANTTTDKPHKPFPKSWLYINIILVGLCGLAVIYGLWSTISYTIMVNNPEPGMNFVNSKSFSQILVENISMNFIFPGIALFWVYALIHGVVLKIPEINAGIILYSAIFSGCLGLLLIVNTIFAIITRHRRRKDPKSAHTAKVNCWLALIPPIFIITTLIVLFFAEIPRPRL